MSSTQATSTPNQAEADPPASAEADRLAAMRDADVARLEKMQGMAESFCTWMHALGAEQMAAGGDDAVPRVRELSNSFNKAARAMRLTLTLKHEVAGLRPLRNARAAAPANQNVANQNMPAPEPALRMYRPDIDPSEWTDAEKAEWGPDSESNKEAEYFDALLRALHADIDEAQPFDEAEMESMNHATMLHSITPMIPHPRLDRVLADYALKQLLEGLPEELIHPLPDSTDSTDSTDPPE